MKDFKGIGVYTIKRYLYTFGEKFVINCLITSYYTIIVFKQLKPYRFCQYRSGCVNTIGGHLQTYIFLAYVHFEEFD